MKVKVVVPYVDVHGNKEFNKNDVINVTDNVNSDWYHIWEGNNLYIIPKVNCKKI